eukprot:1128837-Prorocentrum_minimum.AAC.1
MLCVRTRSSRHVVFVLVRLGEAHRAEGAAWRELDVARDERSRRDEQRVHKVREEPKHLRAHTDRAPGALRELGAATV